MKKMMMLFVAMAFIAFVSISGNIYAADDAKPMDKAAKSAAPMDKTQDFSHWIGKDVKNAAGEDLGDVKDFVRDDNGRISLVVLSHGGFMGIGEKKVAVPFSAFSYDQNADHLVLDATKDQLANAPKFADDKKIADRAYAEEVYRHFGQRPYWTEKGGAERRRHEQRGHEQKRHGQRHGSG